MENSAQKKGHKHSEHAHYHHHKIHMEDQSTQNDSLHSHNHQQKSKITGRILIRILIILGIVLILSAIIGASYYFYQQRKTTTQTPKESPTGKYTSVYDPVKALSIPKNNAAQNGPFSCPSVAAFCITDANYQGIQLAGKLANQAPINAAFDGDAQAFSIMNPQNEGKSDDYSLIILTNPAQGLKAYYMLKGTTFEGRKAVKAGERIATASGDVLSLPKDASLSFTLSVASTSGIKPLELERANFK